MVRNAIRWSGAHIDEPLSLSDASGVIRVIADFVRDAWLELQQERYDWRFRSLHNIVGLVEEDSDYINWSTGNIVGISFSGTASYLDADYIQQGGSEITDDFTPQSFRIAEAPLDGSGDPLPVDFDRYIDNEQTLLCYSTWDQWKQNLDRSQKLKEPAQPAFVARSPEGIFRVWPRADKDYYVFATGTLEPQMLEQDSDIPVSLPDRYHNGIVWRAIVDFALYHSDASMLEMARMKYRPYKKWLERREAPEMSLDTTRLYGDY